MSGRIQVVFGQPLVGGGQHGAHRDVHPAGLEGLGQSVVRDRLERRIVRDYADDDAAGRRDLVRRVHKRRPPPDQRPGLFARAVVDLQCEPCGQQVRCDRTPEIAQADKTDLLRHECSFDPACDSPPGAKLSPHIASMDVSCPAGGLLDLLGLVHVQVVDAVDRARLVADLPRDVPVAGY